MVEMNKDVFEKRLKEVTVKIFNEFKPEMIVLFGSWAWGKPNIDSDVDLLIVKETTDTRTLARNIDRLVFPRSFPLDLIVINPQDMERRKELNDLFIKDILTRGRVLHTN